MTATSSPAEPPESTLAAVKSALLAGLLDEYGEDAETWTAMRSLDRIAAAILAATPTAAHVAEPESTLAAGSECCCEYVDGCAHSGARCCKHATLLAAADRIVTSRDAHVAELEAALAAAEARLRAAQSALAACREVAAKRAEREREVGL